jgi:hypothetical protein
MLGRSGSTSSKLGSSGDAMALAIADDLRCQATEVNLRVRDIEIVLDAYEYDES